jgi:uncharacterized membrane protein YdbT with pleckstrin-like domain
MNASKDDLFRISEEDLPLYRAQPAMFRNHPILFIACLAVPAWLILQDHGQTRPQGVVLAAFSALALLVWWLGCLATTLTVTDRRVVLRKGILGRDINEILIKDIRNVRIHQGPLQRLFSVGSLGLSSSGQADIEIRVDGIPHPDRVLELINRNRP